jgi:hypothetical protein
MLDGLAATFGHPSRIITGLMGEEAARELFHSDDFPTEPPDDAMFADLPPIEGGGISAVIIETEEFA